MRGCQRSGGDRVRMGGSHGAWVHGQGGMQQRGSHSAWLLPVMRHAGLLHIHRGSRGWQCHPCNCGRLEPTCVRPQGSNMDGTRNMSHPA